MEQAHGNVLKERWLKLEQDVRNAVGTAKNAEGAVSNITEAFKAQNYGVFILKGANLNTIFGSETQKTNLRKYL